MTEAAAKAFYVVAELQDQGSEPYAVLRAVKLPEDGEGEMSATVHSLHWTRDEALAEARRMSGALQ